MQILKPLMSIAIAASALSAPTIAAAHSGGKDKNGCHSGSEEYHCHRGGNSAPTASYETTSTPSRSSATFQGKAAVRALPLPDTTRVPATVDDIPEAAPQVRQMRSKPVQTFDDPLFLRTGREGPFDPANPFQ
jgi:hypothetical protein